MEIREFGECAYASDGGSIRLSFTDDTGQERDLIVIQDVIPILPETAPGPGWRNGAVLLDGDRVDSPERLRRLRDALLADFASLPEGLARVPLPERTLVIGADLTDYLTLDPSGRVGWLVAEAARRIDAALGEGTDSPGPEPPIVGA